MADIQLKKTVIVLFASIFAIVSTATPKCLSDSGTAICARGNIGVVKRLPIYYRNETKLVFENSSSPIILRPGIFEKLRNVEWLSLRECGISKVPENAFRGLSLTHLNLASNSIKILPENFFADFKRLRYLDLSRNRFTRLTFDGALLPVLNYLDVSENQLSVLKFSNNFNKLETINFSKNLLKEFQSDWMIRLPKIKILSIAGNPFDKKYKEFINYVFASSNVTVDPVNYFALDGGWKVIKGKNSMMDKSEAANFEEARMAGDEIEDEFKISPDMIKSLDPKELANLVGRILTLRDFTLKEREMIEKERNLNRFESSKVRMELNRVEQIKKRVSELFKLSVEATAEDIVKKICDKIPRETWWQKTKRWGCYKFYKLAKHISGNL